MNPRIQFSVLLTVVSINSVYANSTQQKPVKYLLHYPASPIEDDKMLNRASYGIWTNEYSLNMNGILLNITKSSRQMPMDVDMEREKNFFTFLLSRTCGFPPA
ncbi:MAG: hypothetical protein ABR969_07180 [Sedimentisphaerales bacterium]